ncbi:splicing factor, CC1-like protein [Trematosphaeria pertusa]|uniref:Splicing factor, CC1-like protein n=1 Tax=Trematosphaeria pertusa TaxID=390896 RepID=A0A6A6IC40_9PLEO|nr:splicing factor, CC1-like protein [Trematosphaeria pertusa]KAF2247063.1 splicing factor, CC1-like protein [Trematosphaeria pertusa]
MAQEDKARKRVSSGSDDARNSDRRDDRDRDRSGRYDRDRRDRDRERERRPQHRDRERDRHRESNGERPSSRDRDSRRRDGSRPRSRKDADTDDDEDRYRRSNSRDRYRVRRDRDRGGDYYMGSARTRSRSPRRDRDDRRDDRRRDRSGDRRRDRGYVDRRGGPARRTRTPTPQATEDDRDKRTIFVQQISQRAEQRHLRSFFEAVGPVVEAQIVTDRVTGRSKGVGYVEFKEEESVAKALELTGQRLKGVPIIAQLAEAEKNRASRAVGEGPVPGTNNPGAPFHRLYVGNIHFSVTEDDLKQIFEPFGELEQVTLQRDQENPARSKGYGFVQFVDPNDAKKALTDMNGFELAGRQIRVGLGNDKFTNESTAHLLRNFPQQAATYQGSAFSGAGGRGAYAGGSGGVFDRAHGRDDRGISGASALDDTDMAGVNFKQVDRNKLMMNLARNEIDVPTKKDAQPVAKARAPVVDKPMASKCIKIENAFDSEEEHKVYGEKWIKGLEEEIKAECNKKYGKVVHISVDANSEGEIYVKFDSVSGGEKALQGLNGRIFNLRMLRASYVVDKIYNSLFGAAASKF